MYDDNDNDNDNDNIYLGFFGGVLLRGSFTSFSFQPLWKIQNIRIRSDVFISHIPSYSKWRKGILILSLVAPKILQKRRKFVPPLATTTTKWGYHHLSGLEIIMFAKRFTGLLTRGKNISFYKSIHSIENKVLNSTTEHKFKIYF